AAQHHVLDPVDDVHPAVAVDSCRVTRVEPAVREGLRSLLRLVPVAADVVRAAHPQLADGARLDGVAGIVDGSATGDRHWQADAVLAAEVGGTRVGDDGARRLRQAVTIARGNLAGELGLDLGNAVRGHRRSAL